MVIGLALTVADVTDWLEVFSGPDGQARPTEQGTIGFDLLNGEASQLDQQVLSILGAVSGDVSDFKAIVELLSEVPPGTPPPSGINAVNLSATLAARTFAELNALGLRVARRRLSGLSVLLSGLPGATFAAVDTNVRTALARIEGAAKKAPRARRATVSDERFQRFVIEGERGSNAGSSPDIGRIVKRVVSEAFAQSPLAVGGQSASMNGAVWKSYTALGIGPVPLYSQNGVSASMGQRAAATSALLGQISVEQAVVSSQ